ncbi:MAG: (d)CMP kinase [Methyloligellaceae bacterium]
MIIAVDGPAASGKGTVARRVAVHYGLPYLDTGALYRATALSVLDNNGNLEDGENAALHASKLKAETLEDPRLRNRTVGASASVVAGHPEVRQALMEYQRNFAAKERGAVLDGRDIGTVICPDADVKLFVTASVEERARRRFAELKIRGEDVDPEQVLADIVERDKRDMSRSTAPLRQSADSYLLDTTNLDIEATFKAAVKVIDDMIRRTGCA